jgi:hypothetical protein
MQTTRETVRTLGDLVAASYDLSSAIAPNASKAAELAARHLERVLLHGSNVRLSAKLERFSRERGSTRDRAGSPRSLRLVAHV